MARIKIVRPDPDHTVYYRVETRGVPEDLMRVIKGVFARMSRG